MTRVACAIAVAEVACVAVSGIAKAATIAPCRRRIRMTVVILFRSTTGVAVTIRTAGMLTTIIGFTGMDIGAIGDCTVRGGPPGWTRP
jgi:hypothetical protein